MKVINSFILTQYIFKHKLQPHLVTRQQQVLHKHAVFFLFLSEYFFVFNYNFNDYCIVALMVSNSYCNQCLMVLLVSKSPLVLDPLYLFSGSVILLSGSSCMLFQKH